MYPSFLYPKLDVRRLNLQKVKFCPLSNFQVRSPLSNFLPCQIPTLVKFRLPLPLPPTTDPPTGCRLRHRSCDLGAAAGSYKLRRSYVLFERELRLRLRTSCVELDQLRAGPGLRLVKFYHELQKFDFFKKLCYNKYRKEKTNKI